jgi:serine-type D-Ala-D-Ala carboxypeptidase/endopeptidase (penicillin-binding protein 4)
MIYFELFRPLEYNPAMGNIKFRFVSSIANFFSQIILARIILASLSFASTILASPTKTRFTSPDGALVGWAVRDAMNDSLLEGQGERLNYTPASTQKLITTWIALDMLGADKTYTTELAYTGVIKDQTLHGDLLIVGGGDPSFADTKMHGERIAEKVFSSWLLALKKSGIKKISGCILGDGTYLEEAGPHPAQIWEDAGNYYAGGTSGLSFNGNIYTLSFSGAATPGKSVKLLGSFPNHIGIAAFDNQLLTGPAKGKDSAFILGGFPSPVRELRGTYPAGRMPFYLKGSLPNPAWTCAREFQDFLVTKGITVNLEPSACGDSLALPNYKPAKKGEFLSGSRIISPPLKEIIRHTNQKSDNSYAAQLLALIGKEGKQTADWRGGLAIVNQYLLQRGFSPKEFHLKDGNGLSRYNWISPGQTSRLLAYASRQKAFPEFRASLVDSQLDRYGQSWDGNGWQGKLWIKTGTLEGVSALAGYLQTKSGRLLAFAITANNFEGKSADIQISFSALLQNWAVKY